MSARCLQSLVDAAFARMAAIVLVLLSACSPMRPPAGVAAEGSASLFPVARTFALERAGTASTFEVELPGSGIDGPLRSVFLGVRAVHDPGSPDAEEAGQRIYRYLDEAALPVRVVVHHYVEGAWRPWTLMRMSTDDGPRDYRYRPHPDPVFRHHRPAHWDGDQLVRAGLWDFDRVYFEYEIGGFGDYLPGRYRISVTSLDDHPALRGGRYELVVAHRRRY